ncbi:MAG: GNAT family N-acetyltransferase, partial [Clostridiaceae bacterium]
MVKEGKDIDSFLLLLQNSNYCRNTYLSFEYYSVLAKYKKPKYFLYLYVEKLNQTIGILPLEKRKIGYVIYGYRFSNYLGYICKESDVEEVDKEITEYLSIKRKNIIIKYYDINTSDKLYNLLINDKFSKGLYLYDCPSCKVTEEFNYLFQKAIPNSKKRTELKKFERKLEMLGKIDVIHIDTLELWEKWKYIFPSLVEVHRNRFSRIYISPDLCFHQNAEYYSKMFESLVVERKAYLSILLLDNVAISFLYAVVSDGIIMDWMPAFDPAFSKYNLGTVHLMKIFKYVCENERYRIFDFSKG